MVTCWDSKYWAEQTGNGLEAVGAHETDCGLKMGLHGLFCEAGPGGAAAVDHRYVGMMLRNLVSVGVSVPSPEGYMPLPMNGDFD
ncbi:hypothetical protein L1987_15792 [Smallanthus sonchifolius]|uniref:Uncharacterized protein n=1 Tax=Smallanthus sonchifolius TaxID=185202 RepID=A0ACB9J835_9ASTR|nr:hypothetical protein L1987_15792 [Smallanthus sonchifolius]